MSYTFLSEQGEEFSAECFSDIPASVLSSLMPTAERSSCSASETASCRDSRYGTTSEPSTDVPGVAWLTMSAAASLAKVCLLPAMGRDWTTRSQPCGTSKPESLARLDPSTSLLKTHQRSLFEEGYESLATLPRWGMTAGGELYPLPMPSGLSELRALITCGNESGFTERLPTTCAADAEHRGRGDLYAKLHNVGRQRVPTPTAKDSTDRGYFIQRDGSRTLSLAGTVRMPTPQSANARAGADLTRETREDSGADDLVTAVARMPTPDARAWRSGKGRKERPGHAPQLEAVVGGQLNPYWVEWLMGWPIGWTALEPLAMDRFRQWLDLHGGY